MVFGARPFGSRSFGDTAPVGAGVMPAVGESGLPQNIELPTLGDLLTINAPAVVASFTIPMATLGSLVTVNGPDIHFPENLNLPTIGGGPAIGGISSITVQQPSPPLTPGTTIIWEEGGVTYTGVVVDADTITITEEDGVPVVNYPYEITDPWFWDNVTIDTSQPIPAVPASSIEPDPRVDVHVCDPANPLTIIGTLDGATSKQWQEVVNDAGSGSVTLQNDDEGIEFATFSRLLRFDLDDQAVFMAAIENRNIVEIAQDEESEEATEVGGRGLLALWDDAVVYPEGGARGRPFSDQRIFNWTSADYYDGGWQKVKTGGKIGGHQQNDPGVAVGFPDPDAEVIWPMNSPGGAGAGGAPVGYAYFRKTINVTTTGWYRMFLSADDGAEVVIDGVQIHAEARLWFHLETQAIDIYLTAGQHQLAVRGENLDNENPDPMTNSAWILLSIIRVKENGTLGEVILRSDTIGWKGVAYPPKPPGMNVGRVIMTLLAEAQARGSLLGWSLSFDDTKDSNGKPWVDEPELAFQCGMDCYNALLQIAESYVEMDTAPAQLILNVYADGYGDTTTVSYTEAENILSLTHEGSV